MRLWAKIPREINRVGRQLSALFVKTTPRRSALEKAALRAIKITTTKGWRSAAPLWEQLWLERNGGFLGKRLLSQIPRRSDPRTDSFSVVEPAIGTTAPKFCVYTTLFQNYDDLKPPVARPAGVDFYCFTDQDLEVPGWTIIRLPSEADASLQGKRYKLFPFIHLPVYEASLFVDANQLRCGDVDRFVRRWCAHEDFVMWAHPDRDDLADEALAVLIFNKYEPRALIGQVEAYLAAGIPKSTGMVEANFIWRRHDSERVRSLMYAWWDEIARHTRRDQISLCFLMWTTGVRPKTLPASLGTSRENSLTNVLPHNPISPIPVRWAPTRPRRVCFVFAERFKTSGSTILRGQQLADLLRERFSEEFEVSYTSELDVREAIVILTKGALATVQPEDLSNLKRNNVALVADYVDDAPAPPIVEMMDLLLTASIRGLIEAASRFNNMRAEYLPHHVDRRINPSIAQSDVFAVGYFGEPKNVVRYETIESLVDFVHVDTRSSAPNWMDKLSAYNLHYAVRPQPRENGPKPFLKGFTAAHCGANILVAADEDDAGYYLGEDYPYLVRSRSEPEIVAMLRLAKETFRAKEWHFAQEAMARLRNLSSASHVAQELRRILRSVG
jgi:hypothetical protein